MIAFLTLAYVGALALLVRVKLLPNTAATWLSTIAWVLFLLTVFIVPMQWGAPAGQARILTHSVPIVPNVAGPVTSVPVHANTPLKKGDVLFEIDRTLYRAKLEAIKARLEFQELRLAQFSQLEVRQAGSRFQVEETRAGVEQLRAELATAEWELAETVVRAPSDGYVTYLALRPGQRVTNLPVAPAMIFIDTERKFIGVQVHQIFLRHIRPGQPVEIAFKTVPGRLFTGKVVSVIQVTTQAQAVAGGTLPSAVEVQPEPFYVRVELDGDPQLDQLPPGSVGTCAIYTDASALTHVIRKITLRIEAITNYVNPFL